MVRIAYFHSNPLIYPNSEISLQPLDIKQEIHSLKESLQNAQKVVKFRSEIATLSNLRNLCTIGCRLYFLKTYKIINMFYFRVLQFSCHGHPTSLAFETSNGELHPVHLDTLRSLFSAGGVETKV